MEISDDRFLLSISVTDGEAGDADGVANGIIVGPSAPAELSISTELSDAEGSGISECFIKTLFK